MSRVWRVALVAVVLAVPASLVVRPALVDLGWPEPKAAPRVPVATPAVTRAAQTTSVDVPRLRSHETVAATPRSAGRNPFLFGNTNVEAVVSSMPPEPAGESPVATPQTEPRDARPGFALIGIAESTVDGALVRTAILSAFGEVMLAKVGDTVTVRYRVAEVLPNSVLLEDTAGGSPLRLTLR